MRAATVPRPAASSCSRSTSSWTTRRCRKARSGGAASPCCATWRTGYSDIAAKAWRRALEPLARADEIAQQLKQGRLHIELLGLRALALDRCGEQALPLLREAIDLAQTYGLLRVFDDAHPALGDWVRDIGAAPPRSAPGRPADGGAAPAAGTRRRARPGEIEPGADAEGAPGARAAGAQPLEQGDRAGDPGRRRDDQVAHEEPLRQARRRHAQAGRLAGAHPRPARARSTERRRGASASCKGRRAVPRATGPPPSASGGPPGDRVP